jgi:hypothetical protein
MRRVSDSSEGGSRGHVRKLAVALWRRACLVAEPIGQSYRIREPEALLEISEADQVTLLVLKHGKAGYHIKVAKS